MRIQKKDRTFLAVRRQIRGMNAPGYEVGIKDSTSGTMQIKILAEQGVEETVPFLKARNRTGCDIYIRPLTGKGSCEGLILLDDVSKNTISNLKRDGFDPAVEVETSPDNYQVWIRVTREQLSHGQATAIAKFLAKKYGGDANSADFRHFGRLAGFTNRKAVYCDNDGRFPFVLAHHCKGQTCLRAESLLGIKVEPKTRISMQEFSAEQTQPCTPEDFYRKLLSFYRARYGAVLDYSRADWAIVRKMFRAGYQPIQIMNTLESSSPLLDERKRGHVFDYIKRTVEKQLGN
jgi:RepB DNA-primase from phage plasmid